MAYLLLRKCLTLDETMNAVSATKSESEVARS